MRKRVLKVMLLFIMLFPVFIIKLNCEGREQTQWGTWVHLPGNTRPTCDCTNPSEDCFCITEEIIQ